MLGIIIALISGALMSIQGIINTGVTKQSGVWLANSWVQLTGFLVCLAFWFFSERKEVGVLKIFSVDNKYMLIGGVLGAFITFTVIKSMANLGPAKAVLIIVISQVVIAYLIELFGMFQFEKVPFQWSKLIGVIIAIVGLIVFKWE